MNYKIGFSLDLATLADDEIEPILKQMLQAGCQAIQLHGHSDLLTLRPKHDDLIKSFPYRTIHLPDLHDEEADQELIAKALQLGDEFGVEIYTLHPVGLGSFGWLHKYFGPGLCIENMDWRKSFGNKPEDLAAVFEELPDAGWTFDVNHIKTNDPSMAQADMFYAGFAPRLRLYHVSGFKDEQTPHTLLAETKQDDIIAKVNDLSKPIIIESLGTQNLGRWEEELNYITSRLSGGEHYGS